MSEYVSAALRALVRRRASGECEYCRLHEEDALLPHQPDHIIATQHRGLTEESNLAWTCVSCNRYKGANLSSIDANTGRIVRLFHPRRDRWARHFHLEGGAIIPRTAVGRVTAYLLRLNRPDRLRVRRRLLEKGLYPRQE